MLSGKRRVWITRAQSETEPCLLSDLLSAEKGLEIIQTPLTEIQWLPYPLPNLDAYDWIFFTSQNAVRGFFHIMSSGAPVMLPSRIRIGAVGPQTRQLLHSMGFPCHFVPPAFSGQEAVQSFLQTYPEPLHLLWPCGSLSDPLFQAALEESGRITTVRLEVYRTIPKTALPEDLLQAIQEEPVDLIVFTSSAAVTVFFQLQLHELIRMSREKPQLACIGPTTAQTLSQFGFFPQIMPEVATFPALAEAIRTALR